MRRTAILATFLAILCTVIGYAADTLDVYFIDVGHGDAILVDYGDWECLIDAGKGVSSSSLELLSVLQCAVTDSTIELAVLSHNHWDHYGGFTDLIANSDFVISAFWKSDDPNADTEKTRWFGFSNAFDSAEFAKERLAAGSIPFVPLPNDLDWSVLAPRILQIQPKDENDNANSLVLGLRYGTVEFLFTGDIIEVDTEDIDGWHAPSNALVLKAPHHGRSNSATQALAKRLEPDLIVVTTGHCVPQTGCTLTQLGIPFLSTSTSGTIHLRTDGESVWVTTDTLSGQVVECTD